LIVIRRKKSRRTVSVAVSQAALLRWIRDFESDAKQMAGGGDPEYMTEAREIAAMRAAVLRKVVKDLLSHLPSTIRVVIPTDP
jgi:hypothetical protein